MITIDDKKLWVSSLAPSTRAGVMTKEENGMNYDYDRNEALAGELVGQAVIALLNRGKDISFAPLLHELRP